MDRRPGYQREPQATVWRCGSCNQAVWKRDDGSFSECFCVINARAELVREDARGTYRFVVCVDIGCVGGLSEAYGKLCERMGKGNDWESSDEAYHPGGVEATKEELAHACAFYWDKHPLDPPPEPEFKRTEQFVRPMGVPAIGEDCKDWDLGSPHKAIGLALIFCGIIGGVILALNWPSN